MSRGKKPSKYYAVYDRADNYLFGGTVKECMNYLGIKTTSVFYRRCVNTREGKDCKERVVKIEDD